MVRIAFIVFVLLFIAGCGDHNAQPKEKAERLAAQADEAMQQQRYEEAERLLGECVDIHAEANNDAKLAETYALLSSAQTSAGKLGPALESLGALRDLYRSAADRTAELHTMFEMAKLRLRLGDITTAEQLLQEAFTNSSLFRLNELHALAALEAGEMQNTLGRYASALPYLTVAQSSFAASSDLPRRNEATTELITALAATGRTDAAYTLFQQMEVQFSHEPHSADWPLFYRTVGEAFVRSGDLAFARANFLQAISILKQNDRAGSRESILSLLDLGELYFSQYSFPEAQQYFVAAYNLAKSAGEDYLQAYLLTRISDCLSKVSIYRKQKDGLIRAAQLYEQAHTLFARVGLGFGEAITTHRLGMVKEFSGDESAAMTFYKRAFEKYLDHTVAPVHYALPVPVEQLLTEPSRPYDAERWFAERLISLLLKFKRNQEALAYHEMMRSIVLQQRLSGMPLEFRDPGKRSRYAAFAAGLAEKQRVQLELYHAGKASGNAAAKLQQRLSYIRSKVESDAVTLIREYPAFSLFGFSQQSLRQFIDGRIPSGTLIADYCIVNGDVWVFLIRPGAPVDAVRLSTYATTVRELMDRTMDALREPSVPRGAAADIAELSRILMQPVERLEPFKLTVIPPVGLERFPFHQLATSQRTITYLPHLMLLGSTALLPRFINSVVSAGYTPDYRWGLEFELRDTRSFFRNTTVLANQQATRQHLENAFGEVLQLSSTFRSDQRGGAFLLSDGSSGKTGTLVPLSVFAALHPFQIVYLSDVQSSLNGMSDVAPVLWMLNGSAGIISTYFPVTPSISRSFSEQFYASLSLDLDPSLAYNKGMVQLGKRKEWREGNAGASYFYYGVR